MPMTERQSEAIRLYTELRSIRKVAAKMRINYSAAHGLIDRAQKWQEAPEGQKAAIEVSGLDITSAKHGWRVVKHKDGSRDSVFWTADTTENPQDIAEALKEGLADALRAEPYTAPKADADLMAVFPVADLHIGLLTDQEEVGDDWDTKKAQVVFTKTFGRIVDATPAATTAIIAQLGDLTHNDDQRNVTPQSGHQLDVDSRYFIILRRAVASMKWAIDTLRKKYPTVIYRGCRGNHDITTHYAVTLALAEHYRDCKGVRIEESANEFYVRQFGANMLMLHHGDKAKPERLALFAADQFAAVWGTTKHRLALSGHVHHETRKEVGGMLFESVGTIIPRDAYAYGHGYSAKRSLVSITLHRNDGEISRARVNL